MTNGNFGERLKEEMAKRGLTQRETAAGAGTTEATLSRYLGGERKPEGLAVLRGLAAFLNVSSDYLLGLTDNPYSKSNLPSEVKDLLTLYLKLTPADRTVVWAVLNKYR